LMRHSTIELTMNKYSHVFAGAESDALEKLPDLSLPSIESQRAIKTGTDGEKNLAENLAFCAAQVFNSVQSSAESNHKGDTITPFSPISEGVKTSNRRSCYPSR